MGVCVCVCLLSHIQLCCNSMDCCHQVALSIGFPRQEYWNGLSFPSLGDLPDTGIKPGSPALQAESLPSEPPGKPIYVCIHTHRYLKVKVKVSPSSPTIWPHGLHSPWNFPGQNTGVGSLSLLQDIFPTQGLNPGLPHCRQILFQLSHQGSPRILDWKACPSSSGSSWVRNPT